jgi:hypothetical protein
VTKARLFSVNLIVARPQCDENMAVLFGNVGALATIHLPFIAYPEKPCPVTKQRKTAIYKGFLTFPPVPTPLFRFTKYASGTEVANVAVGGIGLWTHLVWTESLSCCHSF